MASKLWGKSALLRKKFVGNPRKKSIKKPFVGDKGQTVFSAKGKALDVSWEQFEPFAREAKAARQFKLATRYFKPKKSEFGKWVLLEAFPKSKKATRATLNHKRKVFAVYVNKSGNKFKPFLEFKKHEFTEEIIDPLTRQLRAKRTSKRSSAFRNAAPIPRHPKELDLTEAPTKYQKQAAKEIKLKYLPIQLRNKGSTSKHILLTGKKEKKVKLKKGEIDTTEAKAFADLFTQNFYKRKNPYQFYFDFGKHAGDALYEIIDTLTTGNLKSRAYLSFIIRARFVMTTGETIDIEPQFDMQSFQLQGGRAFFNGFVREECYAHFVHELVKLQLVTGGSATFVSQQEVNKGKKKKDWKNWQGKNWGKANFKTAEIAAFSFQILRNQRVAMD
jgi:hypothetical protein